MPSALIIIPCLNEEAYLQNLVEQLAVNQEHRIVIADGGSTDRTTDIARALIHRFPNTALLDNPKRLQSAAINLAVEIYGNEVDYLIRIDAHADYPDHFCETLLAEAEANMADSVTVVMKTVGRTPFQRAVAAAQNSKLGNGGSAHRLANIEGRWVDHGHHALMRITAFRDTGGYDETFAHNEDAELDTRLRAKGYKIWLTGRAPIIYYPRGKPFPLLRQYIGYGTGRARTIMKHHLRPKLRQMLPAFVLPAALLVLLTPYMWLALVPFTFWFCSCLGYGLYLGRKSNDSAIALAGPAALIMHFGWSLGFWRTVIYAGLNR